MKAEDPRVRRNLLVFSPPGSDATDDPSRLIERRTPLNHLSSASGTTLVNILRVYLQLLSPETV